jgi:integrase
VKFLTLTECRKLLSTAAEHYPQAVASYAVLLFAGLRPSEFERLRTEDVSPDGIEINADSKIKKRRHITPCATLRLWLTAHPFERVNNFRRTHQAVRYLAGWDVWTDPDFFTPPPTSEEDNKKHRPKWPTDATRHSFATYSINKGVTLDHFLWEFGHSGNTRTLKTHYLGRASKKQGLEFFSIVPEGVEAPAAIQPVESVA